MENILQIGLGERSGDWVTHKESKPSRKEPHRKRSSAAQALHLIYGVIAERRIICHSGRSPSFAWRYRQNGASYAIAQEDNGAQQRSTNAQLKMAWLENSRWRQNGAQREWQRSRGRQNGASGARLAQSSMERKKKKILFFFSHQESNPVASGS